jgi:hypothetical protein
VPVGSDGLLAMVRTIEAIRITEDARLLGTIDRNRDSYNTVRTFVAVHKRGIKNYKKVLTY